MGSWHSSEENPAKNMSQSSAPPPPRTLTPTEQLEQYAHRVDTELRPKVNDYSESAGRARTKSAAEKFLKTNERQFLEINHYLEQAEDKVDAVHAGSDDVIRAHRKRVGGDIRKLSKQLHTSKASLDQLSAS